MSPTVSPTATPVERDTLPGEPFPVRFMQKCGVF